MSGDSQKPSLSPSREKELMGCPYAIPKSGVWTCPVLNASDSNRALLRCNDKHRNECAAIFVRKSGGRISIDRTTHREEWVRGHRSYGYDSGRDINREAEFERMRDEIEEEFGDS